MTTLPQLHRIRWAVRGALALGVVASTVANILHANPNPISQTIAAWPPVALLLTVELISRVPVGQRSRAIARLATTAAIAGIAAWVSYWHMVGVAARYGETGASPYLLPLSVDGLVVVASICLVELGGRIRTTQQRQEDPVEQLVDEPDTRAPADTTVAAEPPPTPSVTDVEAPAVHAAPRRPARRTSAADRVARAAARTPHATPAEIAARLKVSERTVQRYLPSPADDTMPSAA